MDRTQRRVNALSRLHFVRKLAKGDKNVKFHNLLCHLTQDLLRESFFALKKDAASGVDEVTWREYEVDLEERLDKLLGNLHTGRFRAKPSKRIYIPKEDGTKRPLGIASLEDKIAQKAVGTILEAIYEVDFKGFSYGFRPGKGPHKALDALSVGLNKLVNYVLDADIQKFFDTIDHKWMMRFLEHRIADKRVLRLIAKWLRAGVSEEGEWSRTTVGTPQGAVISPLLANVYLHYVLDLWVHNWRTNRKVGFVMIVRFADDFVLGFQYKWAAEEFLELLKGRLQKFGLTLHSEKTRLIEFGRFAAENRMKRNEGKPETFDFLGFTHISGKSRKGKFQIIRQTIKKRMRRKLQEIKKVLKWRREDPIAKQGEWLKKVVQGYMNYYAVPLNCYAMGQFRTQVIRMWMTSLRRRSQKHRMTWKRFSRFVQMWIPKVKVLHPYPSERFYANT